MRQRKRIDLEVAVADIPGTPTLVRGSLFLLQQSWL